MRFSLLPVLALLLSVLPAVSCGSGDPTEGCQDSECSATQRCVQNACRPACETQDDCPVGQNCAGWGFANGDRGSYCVVLDYAKRGSTGHTEACTSDVECDTLRGYACRAGRCGLGSNLPPDPPEPTSSLFTACRDQSGCDARRGQECVDGLCRVPCDDHFDCASVGVCESRASGAFCSQGPRAKAGQYFATCARGSSDCDAESGFICLSSGVGDLDSYCTRDCQMDADCPSGFACGTVSATPCDDQCGLLGQNAQGCVPSSEIGAGRRYQCQTPFGLARSVCTKRGFCSSCERDEDCRAVAGGICAKDASGQRICTVECDPSVDSCPWGEATECRVWDQERNLFTCGHRFGSCRGVGNACDPCASTSDCMGKGYCTRAAFTGEQFCLDLTLECDCGEDADANGTCTGHGCPTSPGGQPMLCFSGSRYEGDPLSHRCVSAGSSGNPIGPSQSGCWVR